MFSITNFTFMVLFSRSSDNRHYTMWGHSFHLLVKQKLFLPSNRCRYISQKLISTQYSLQNPIIFSISSMSPFTVILKGFPIQILTSSVITTPTYQDIRSRNFILFRQKFAKRCIRKYSIFHKCCRTFSPIDTFTIVKHGEKKTSTITFQDFSLCEKKYINNFLLISQKILQ